MADIVAIGEMIVDFTTISGENGEIYYKQNAGGAPANVVCMAARLGTTSAIIGKVGKDIFGEFMKKELSDRGVDIRGVISDDKLLTALAFVRNTEDGSRDFMFYRKNTADLSLSFFEVDKSIIDACNIFHFGALSLVSEPAKSAAVNAVEYAKSKGKIISYDPNWRPGLWNSPDEAKKEMRSVLRYVDVIKVSEEELGIVSDCGNMLPGIAKLLDLGIKVVCVTQGAKGCFIATKKDIETCPAYTVETVDTLGSGDGFLGAFLHRLNESHKKPEELSSEELHDMASFANACGAMISMKKGAIPAMPDMKEVREFLAKYDDVCEIPGL